ncbi:MAG TPA: anti-sigma factor [Candidatus Cybelea sp.]|nr:anti-sigma factor [Candidatus Cybelea sp.]
MDWTCTLAEERVSEFLEGQLAPSEAAAFSAHIDACGKCGELVARVGHLMSQMHALHPVEVPSGLEARIVEATLGRRSRRWFAWVPLLWQPRFAMGIATVALCCVVVVQAGGVTPGKLRRVDLNPVSMLRNVNRQAHLTYARGVKFVNDLRVVYEIQSRLEPTPSAEENPPRQKQQESKPNPNYPQQKSETHPGRPHNAGGALFASLLASGSLESPR